MMLETTNAGDELPLTPLTVRERVFSISSTAVFEIVTEAQACAVSVKKDPPNSASTPNMAGVTFNHTALIALVGV
jgi:hypothetical protein